MVNPICKLIWHEDFLPGSVPSKDTKENDLLPRTKNATERFFI